MRGSRIGFSWHLGEKTPVEHFLHAVVIGTRKGARIVESGVQNNDIMYIRCALPMPPPLSSVARRSALVMRDASHTHMPPARPHSPRPHPQPTTIMPPANRPHA